MTKAEIVRECSKSPITEYRSRTKAPDLRGGVQDRHRVGDTNGPRLAWATPNKTRLPNLWHPPRRLD